jgi:hypothetical protein
MSGEPTKPKSADAKADAKANEKADAKPNANAKADEKAGEARSLPDAKSSTSEDIAAFVEKARAMSPHAAGGRGRLVFALDATMSCNDIEKKIDIKKKTNERGHLQRKGYSDRKDWVKES